MTSVLAVFSCRRLEHIQADRVIAISISRVSMLTRDIKKTGPLPLIWHNFSNSQQSLIIFGRERRYSISNSVSKKFSNWLRTSCVVSITTVATWHTWTADFWADFEQCIIGRAINEWQNDCGLVSMLKDSIRTRVVTFDTAKHFIIPIVTLFVKRFNFSVHKAA